MYHLCDLMTIYGVVQSCTDAVHNAIRNLQSIVLRHLVPYQRIPVKSEGGSSESACTTTTLITIACGPSGQTDVRTRVVTTIHVKNEQQSNEWGWNGCTLFDDIVHVCLCRDTSRMDRNIVVDHNWHPVYHRGVHRPVGSLRPTL